MVQRQVMVIVDDLTGKELLPDTAETVRFALDGVHYELDTDRRAAERLRNTLAPYVSAGRRASVDGRRRRPIVGHTKVEPDPKAVRVWAAANGIKVSPRGRIPASVIDQFQAAGY